MFLIDMLANDQLDNKLLGLHLTVLRQNHGANYQNAEMLLYEMGVSLFDMEGWEHVGWNQCTLSVRCNL